MEANLRQQLAKAHERAAALVADAVRIVAMTRQVRHACRNTRNLAGLLRQIRALKLRVHRELR